MNFQKWLCLHTNFIIFQKYILGYLQEILNRTIRGGKIRPDPRNLADPNQSDIIFQKAKLTRTRLYSDPNDLEPEITRN
jgi:hypothetical protein